MNVTRIELRDFRNYEAQVCEPCRGVNIITGDNAQGKTNLLEALYLCGVGKSPRTPRNRELIRMGCSRGYIRVETEKSYGKERIEIVLDKTQNKRIAINGLPVTRIGQLMGVLQTVFFSPDELKLVKDGPAERRRFMDIALSQISRSYFYLLSRYNDILSQRNSLLKSGRATSDALEVWDVQLADCGAAIIHTRRGFIERLKSVAAEEHSFLTDGKEELKLEYESLDGESVAEIKAVFASELARSRERDCSLGYTGAGAHKDDLCITLNGIDARKFGSQGQQRTAALSLKLAEIEFSRTEKGETPILLLDDVMGELDRTRRERLLERIRGAQAFITCTDAERVGGDRTFRISGGVITRI